MLESNILEKLTKVTQLLSKIQKYTSEFQIYISPDFKANILNVKVYTFDVYEEEKNVILYAIDEEINLLVSTANQELNYLIEKIEELIQVQTNSSTTKN